MKTDLAITLLNKRRQLKFGYGALKILGNKWGCNSIQKVGQEIQKSFANIEELDFETNDKIVDIVLAALENARVDVSEIDSDDLLNELFFQDQEKMQTIMTSFVDSMPQGKEEPKKKPVKKVASKDKK